MTTFNPFAPNDAPNLDHLSYDPADYVAAARIFELYAKYCALKAESMTLRLAGNVAEALKVERKTDAIFHLLPESATW
jgi:hypothetical protein